MRLKRILPLLLIFILQLQTVLGNVAGGYGTGYSTGYNNYHCFCIGDCHYLCNIVFNIHNVNIGVNEILFLSSPIIFLLTFLLLIIYTLVNKRLLKKQRNINITISIFSFLLCVALIIFIILISQCALFGASNWYCCHDSYY